MSKKQDVSADRARRGTNAVRQSRAGKFESDAINLYTPPPRVKAWINAKAARFQAEIQRAAFGRSERWLQ